MKKIILAILAMTTAFNIMAQMPHDAIYMNKKDFCIAIIGGQTSFNEYWEGNLLRDNLNMGTNTTQSLMPMIAYGIGSKLNLIASIPYVRVSNSAGNLMPQEGVQDLTVGLKYRFLDKQGLSLHAWLGGSTPIGNYVADFLPMSIGLGAKTGTGRLIARYQHKSGLYLQGHGAYTYRSTVKIDRDAYQFDSKIINSNWIAVPNAIETRAALGYNRNGIQIEGFLSRFACESGDDIRRNDMPFPTNNMKANMVGGYLKYQPKNLGFNLQWSQCAKGLNVGKTKQISIGLLYQIKVKAAGKN